MSNGKGDGGTGRDEDAAADERGLQVHTCTRNQADENTHVLSCLIFWPRLLMLMHPSKSLHFDHASRKGQSFVSMLGLEW